MQKDLSEAPRSKLGFPSEKFSCRQSLWQSPGPGSQAQLQGEPQHSLDLPLC